MLESKKTLCSDCIHRRVCFYKDKFLTAQKAAEDLTVVFNNIEKPMNLRDIEWIRPIMLSCVHYASDYLKTDAQRSSL